LAFGRFLTSDEYQIGFAKLAPGFVPGTQAAAADPSRYAVQDGSELLAQSVQIAATSMETAEVLSNPLWTHDMRTTLTQLISRAMTGDITPRQALEEAVEYGNLNLQYRPPARDRPPPPPIRRSLRHMRAYRAHIPWLLAGPALIWVCVFALWPFINTVVLSFTDARPLAGGGFIGLENYATLLQDSRFWHALLTCLVYAVLCVPLLTFLPLVLAILVEKQIPFISAFRTTFYFPVIASVVVVGLIFTWLFDSRGVVNEAL